MFDMVLNKLNGALCRCHRCRCSKFLYSAGIRENGGKKDIFREIGIVSEYELIALKICFLKTRHRTL